MGQDECDIDHGEKARRVGRIQHAQGSPSSGEEVSSGLVRTLHEGSSEEPGAGVAQEMERLGGQLGRNVAKGPENQGSSLST